MPIVYSAQALHQPYVPPAPKIEAPKPRPVERPKPKDRRLKVTEATLATIRAMWGQPLAEIAKALRKLLRRGDLTTKEKALLAGFKSASGARRRARQIGLARA
jgi:hypothetical protein